MQAHFRRDHPGFIRDEEPSAGLLAQVAVGLLAASQVVAGQVV